VNAYIVYLRKFFAPYDLASYYPYTAVSGTRVVIAVVILSAISLLVWRFRQHSPWLLTGWLWFLGMMVPVIGIVRVGAQSYADRYTYLPIIGVIVMVVWGGAELLGRFNLGLSKVGTAAVAICACAILAWHQSGFWKDGFSLYTRELTVTEGNWHAHLGLGNMLVNRDRVNEAMRHFYAVLDTNPRSVDAHNNLGMCFRRQGQNREALFHFLRAAEINPDNPTVHFNLGVTFTALGNKAEAARHLQTVLLIDPADQEARRYLEFLDGSGY
jgi:tetratricopeptide (TPR) repeat protein